MTPASKPVWRVQLDPECTPEWVDVLCPDGLYDAVLGQPVTLTRIVWARHTETAQRMRYVYVPSIPQWRDLSALFDWLYV